MRIVAALGGNALLRRDQAPTVQAQRDNVHAAAELLAPLALQHEFVITHGNGPQVGLLAQQAASSPPAERYPLDVLGAQTDGMIGYLLEQELRGILPPGSPVATLLTLVEVDAADPGFTNPNKFVGPGYERAAAEDLARAHGWTFERDGARWRRVVPSPAPRRIVDSAPIKWLLAHGAVVICAGGGGIPVIRSPPGGRGLIGVEAVVDKDFCSELLARDLAADLLVMLTDVDAVYQDWDSPVRRAIRRATVAELSAMSFAAGSMGPKVAAACRFVAATGRMAVIGALADLERVIGGDAGTVVVPDAAAQAGAG